MKALAGGMPAKGGVQSNHYQRSCLAACHTSSRRTDAHALDWSFRLRGPAIAAAAAAIMIAHPALASVEQSFTRNCAGCHAGGGNVVQAGASLSTTDLRRNGALDPKAMYDIIWGGKGRMPGYGQGCQPKGKCTFGPRLPDEEIQQLVDYTLQQAEAGWK